MKPHTNNEVVRLEDENRKLRHALERIDEILSENTISSIPYPTMDLHGDIVEIRQDTTHTLYALGNSDLRSPDAAAKPYVFNEHATERFAQAVSLFFNETVAVTLQRARIADIADIITGVLGPVDEEEPQATEETEPMDLEAQILRRLSLGEDAEANVAQLYEYTDAECMADIEEILADLVEKKKIIRFYRVRTPFDHNDGIADYATLDEIPEEFEDEWRDPPEPFTRAQAIIDHRYKLAR